MAIARTWSARATSEGAAGYVAYFRDTLAPVLAQLAGYLGATIFERPSGEIIELTVVTRWASLDAIRAFAGEAYEHAVVEPEARALLLAFDARVSHAQIVLELAR